jgi:hypothetical protein
MFATQSSKHRDQYWLHDFSNTGADRRNGAVSDNESEDGEEGDYTVYECPGLAPVSRYTYILLLLKK